MKPLSVALIVAACFASGCSSGPTDFTRDYQAALAQRPGVVLRDDAAGRAAAKGFASLYGDLSADNVKARAREVYAADAWFNDTIATKSGIDAIERYLLKTAEGSEKVSAEVESVAVSGSDCYVRWTMEVRSKGLAGGRPVATAGMSHLRFDREGKILLHQDFWNPAAGIYQQLPVLGPAIRYVDGLIVGQ